MEKEFNITGLCIPSQHFMVDISKKIKSIILLIEKGKYFTINRPRQYGKTTTLTELTKTLKNSSDFLCLDTSFEGIGSESYNSIKSFAESFVLQIRKQVVFQKLEKHLNFLNQNSQIEDFYGLSLFITEFCLIENKKIVLLIDEVDKSMNNQLFLDFLGMLRNKYLDRGKGSDTTFHSVILAGVYDVKTMKLKINPNTEFKYNSPWNIATDFTVDMSFDPDEIATMLTDYVADKKNEMDIPAISARIYHYTSGYPFLVSRICKEVDEKIIAVTGSKQWRVNDIDLAVKSIVNERNTNFESLVKHIEEYPEINEYLEDIILAKKQYSYNALNQTIYLGEIHGIFKKQGGKLAISNKIYEEIITNYIISKLEKLKDISDDVVQSSYIKPDGRLSIDKVLFKFQEVIKEKYSKSDILKIKEFLEKDLRLLFLVFLKPIINGIGFSFKELETSEEKRLDIVIIFRDEKFIVELKLWRGEEYHQQGIIRLKDYMYREGAGRGFMLIMDKTRHKEFTSNMEEEILMVWI